MAATNLFRMVLLSLLLVSGMNAAPTRLQATTEVEETTAATTALVTEAEQIATTHPVLGDIHPALAKIDERIINRRHIPLQNCKELQDYGFSKSGLYVVQPNDNGGEFVVYCDMNLLGGGWTVIQRRVNGDIAFDKNFASYRNGFGDTFENFWLGLEKIHRLTHSPNPANAEIELYVGLENFHSQTARALYSYFAVENEDAGYTLRISGYDVKQSTAGDSLGSHNGQKFSTFDSDQDSHKFVNCAKETKGGWWYRDCHDSNLNGVWYDDGSLADSLIPDGIIWQHWLGNSYSLKTTVLAMRPVVR